MMVDSSDSDSSSGGGSGSGTLVILRIVGIVVN